MCGMVWEWIECRRKVRDGQGKHKRLRKGKLCYCFTSTWIHSHSASVWSVNVWSWAAQIHRRTNSSQALQLTAGYYFSRRSAEGGRGDSRAFCFEQLRFARSSVFKWLFRLMKQLPVVATTVTAAASIAWLSFGHRSSVWIADVTQRAEGYSLVCLVVWDVVDGSVMLWDGELLKVLRLVHSIQNIRHGVTSGSHYNWVSFAW